MNAAKVVIHTDPLPASFTVEDSTVKGFIIAGMRRSRSYDPTKFDLSTQCPECGYKIQPHELLRIDGERIHCPHCKRDVVIPAKGGIGTAVPIKNEG
jgi:hypothetical protein